MKSIKLSFIGLLLLVLLFSVPTKTMAQEESGIDFDKPVVLVHGIGGAPYNFYSIERKLRSIGYDRSDLHAINFRDKTGNNYRNSRQLRDYIDDVLSNYDVEEVNIIAHSMGGANTLRYLTRLGGVDKVDKVITLGGANRLGATSVPSGVDFTSIYSSSDSIVSISMSRISGADNIHVSGVSHLRLLTSSRVQDLIVESLGN